MLQRAAKVILKRQGEQWVLEWVLEKIGSGLTLRNNIKRIKRKLKYFGHICDKRVSFDKDILQGMIEGRWGPLPTAWTDRMKKYTAFIQETRLPEDRSRWPLVKATAVPMGTIWLETGIQSERKTDREEVKRRERGGNNSVLNTFKLYQIAIFHFILPRFKLLKKLPIGDFWIANW